jgi:hypothetical protein
LQVTPAVPVQLAWACAEACPFPATAVALVATWPAPMVPLPSPDADASACLPASSSLCAS